MINFSLGEEQKALKELARQFAQNEIAPLAAEYDREAKHPIAIIEKAHGLGQVSRCYCPERLILYLQHFGTSSERVYRIMRFGASSVPYPA